MQKSTDNPQPIAGRVRQFEQLHVRHQATMRLGQQQVPSRVSFRHLPASHLEEQTSSTEPLQGSKPRIHCSAAHNQKKHVTLRSKSDTHEDRRRSIEGSNEAETQRQTQQGWELIHRRFKRCSQPLSTDRHRPVEETSLNESGMNFRSPPHGMSDSIQSSYRTKNNEYNEIHQRNGSSQVSAPKATFMEEQLFSEPHSGQISESHPAERRQEQPIQQGYHHSVSSLLSEPFSSVVRQFQEQIDTLHRTQSSITSTSTIEKPPGPVDIQFLQKCLENVESKRKQTENVLRNVFRQYRKLTDISKKLKADRVSLQESLSQVIEELKTERQRSYPIQPCTETEKSGGSAQAHTAYVLELKKQRDSSIQELFRLRKSHKTDLNDIEQKWQSRILEIQDDAARAKKEMENALEAAQAQYQKLKLNEKELMEDLDAGERWAKEAENRELELGTRIEQLDAENIHLAEQMRIADSKKPFLDLADEDGWKQIGPEDDMQQNAEIAKTDQPLTPVDEKNSLSFWKRQYTMLDEKNVELMNEMDHIRHRDQSDRASKEKLYSERLRKLEREQQACVKIRREFGMLRQQAEQSETELQMAKTKFETAENEVNELKAQMELVRADRVRKTDSERRPDSVTAAAITASTELANAQTQILVLKNALRQAEANNNIR